MCTITNPLFTPSEVYVDVIITKYDHTRGSDKDQSVNDIEVWVWMQPIPDTGEILPVIPV